MVEVSVEAEGGELLPYQGEKKVTISIQNVRKRELIKYWSREEVNEKLRLCDKSRDKMLLIFLWMTGVRVTEAVSVRKQDIDFLNHVIKIRWLKNRKYKERMLPIHPHLKDILEAYVGPLNLADRVFPYTRFRAHAIVKRWMGGHPHQFRHSFAINFLRQGGNIEVLHRILGHKSIQATMEYLKVVPTDQGQELMKIQFN